MTEWPHLCSSLAAGPHWRRSDEKRGLPGHIRTFHCRLNGSSLGLRTRRPSYIHLGLPASKTSTLISVSVIDIVTFAGLISVPVKASPAGPSPPTCVGVISAAKEKTCAWVPGWRSWRVGVGGTPGTVRGSNACCYDSWRLKNDDCSERPLTINALFLS